MKISGYTPGSIYRRFYGSNMYRLNRHAVSNQVGALNSLGTTISSAITTQSDGYTELAAWKYAMRVQAEAQAKLNAAVASVKVVSA